MKTPTEREHLRSILMQTILDNCGNTPAGLVRAVLGEVESILMAASDNVTIDELKEKMVR